jgi:hypothetical protein
VNYRRLNLGTILQCDFTHLALAKDEPNSHTYSQSGYNKWMPKIDSIDQIPFVISISLLKVEDIRELDAPISLIRLN